MKLWIECVGKGVAGNRLYFVWKIAPTWDEDHGYWMDHGPGTCRSLCPLYMEFLFGDSFDALLPGELMELNVKHVETWVMK